MEWNGMEWSGMEWSGMEWSGMEWNATQRNAMQCNVDAGGVADEPRRARAPAAVTRGGRSDDAPRFVTRRASLQGDVHVMNRNVMFSSCDLIMTRRTFSAMCMP